MYIKLTPPKRKHRVEVWERAHTMLEHQAIQLLEQANHQAEILTEEMAAIQEISDPDTRRFREKEWTKTLKQYEQIETALTLNRRKMDHVERTIERLRGR